MTKARRTEEMAWWDHWNTESRTTDFTEDSDYARTGLQVVNEPQRLELDKPMILEVGCGTGWLAEKLANVGQYVGLDLSPAAVEAAKKRVPSAHFHVADFHAWQADAGSFDIVVMVDTIDYFRDQDRALSRAFRLLKPGGWLVLSTS